MDNYKYMVSIKCITYNHADFIVNALDGFCMQETTFPYVTTIIDDASTDGEQEVIKGYLQEYFNLQDTAIVRIEETKDYSLIFAQHNINKNCYFAVLFLKYNHNSIHKDKTAYFAEWTNSAKYLANCEGDDYWTHPRKLQTQVNYMEKNPNVSMCTHAYKIVTERNQSICDVHTLTHEGLLDVGRVIENVEKPQMATFLYRSSIMKKYPDFFRQLSVGDYPLRVYAAITGGIYYFDSCLSCYRSFSSSSWTKKMLTNSTEYVTHFDRLISFAQELDAYTEGLYHNSIARRIDMCMCLKQLNTKNIFKAIKTEYFRDLSIKEKMQVLFRQLTPLTWYYYTKIHLKIKFSKSKKLNR